MNRSAQRAEIILRFYLFDLFLAIFRHIKFILIFAQIAALEATAIKGMKAHMIVKCSPFLVIFCKISNCRTHVVMVHAVQIFKSMVQGDWLLTRLKAFANMHNFNHTR